MFLQALPTQSWGEKEIELLLSEAYFPYFLHLCSCANEMGM